MLLIQHSKASLDFKFLNDRYMRGKESVGKFLGSKHKVISLDSITLAHSTVLEMQAAMGQNGFLNLYDFQVSSFFRNDTLFYTFPLSSPITPFQPRLTIMVVDSTLWPQRALICKDFFLGLNPLLFEVSSPSMRPSLFARAYLQGTKEHFVGFCFPNGIPQQARLQFCETGACWRTKCWGTLFEQLVQLFFLDIPPKTLKSSGISALSSLNGWPRIMDVYEVAVNFADSAHQGDKRKKSQQCNPTYISKTCSVFICVSLCLRVCLGALSIFLFQIVLRSVEGMAAMVSVHGGGQWVKSKALLGSISGIERSRVNELVNPEPDRPLAPHWRAPLAKECFFEFLLLDFNHIPCMQFWGVGTILSS